MLCVQEGGLECLQRDATQRNLGEVQAIARFPLSKTVKDLKKFLGIVNYYRHFFTKAAHH